MRTNAKLKFVAAAAVAAVLLALAPASADTGASSETQQPSYTVGDQQPVSQGGSYDPYNGVDTGSEWPDGPPVVSPRPTPWVIVRCKFADVSSEPQTDDFFRRFFTEPGNGGMYDYIRDMSFGRATLAGSWVTRWYTTDFTKAEETREVNDAEATAGSDVATSEAADFTASDVGKWIFIRGAGPDARTPDHRFRITAVLDERRVRMEMPAGRSVSGAYATFVNDRPVYTQHCLDAAVRSGEVNFPDYFGIVIAYNDTIDLFGTSRWTLAANGVTRNYGLAFTDPMAWQVTLTGHEMLHGYGLPHSFGQAPARREYGDTHDMMSCGDCSWTWGFNGGSGPSLNVAYRDRLRWLEGSVYRNSSYVCPTVQPTRRFLLRNVDRPTDVLGAGEGYVAGMLELGGAHQYSIELRRQRGWDAGIPGTAVLVREVRDGVTYVAANLVPGGSHRDYDHNLEISVDWLDEADGRAVIRLSSFDPYRTGC